MRARNRVGIGLLYRPTRLHRLAESIPWLPKRLQILGSFQWQKMNWVPLYTVDFPYGNLLLYGKVSRHIYKINEFKLDTVI
jgi:hypothetical protein